MLERIEIVSLFPEMFQALNYGITGRAIKNQLLQVGFNNPRDYTSDKHRTVDDRPYGGGPGMLMKYQPLKLAIDAAKQAVDMDETAEQSQKVIYLSPQGKPLTQTGVKQLSQTQHLVLLCGRYEGIDERVVDCCIDEEWSIGDYVLSGGELPAMVLIDALVRLIPGALGHNESASSDSFYSGLLDHPHYTRPEQIDGRNVPDILLSGDHQAIEEWRFKQSLSRTLERRPDLLEQLDEHDLGHLSEQQHKWLEQLKKN